MRITNVPPRPPSRPTATGASTQTENVGVREELEDPEAPQFLNLIQPSFS